MRGTKKLRRRRIRSVRTWNKRRAGKTRMVNRAAEKRELANVTKMC